jgi:hypothetical protein
MERNVPCRQSFSIESSEAVMEPKILLTMVLMLAIQLVAYFGSRTKSRPQSTETDLRAG